MEQVRLVAAKYKSEPEVLRNFLVKRAATQMTCDKIKAQYQELLRQLQRIQEDIRAQEQRVQEALTTVSSP